MPKIPFENSLLVVHYWSLNADATFGTFSNHFLKTHLSDLSDVTNGALTASQALKIDRKMDDGQPETGDVLGRSGATGSCIIDSSTHVYPANDARATCNVGVRMNF